MVDGSSTQLWPPLGRVAKFEVKIVRGKMKQETARNEVGKTE